MEVEERNDVNPICPHCDQALDVVFVNSKVKFRGSSAVIGVKSTFVRIA